jgi:hypothetical protein
VPIEGHARQIKKILQHTSKILGKKSVEAVREGEGERVYCLLEPR